MAHPKSSQTPAPVCGMNKKHSAWQEPTPNSITCLAGGAEMLRVSPDGFWVRGTRVVQDDNEAQVVYNAFKAWMTWAQLNKDYQ